MIENLSRLLDKVEMLLLREKEGRHGKKTDPSSKFGKSESELEVTSDEK